MSGIMLDFSPINLYNILIYDEKGRKNGNRMEKTN
jgi:hypothetical protein